MLVSAGKSPNASSPMLVTLAGIFRLLSVWQSCNAPFAMLVTLPSVGIVLVLQARISVLVFVSIRQLFLL